MAGIVDALSGINTGASTRVNPKAPGGATARTLSSFAFGGGIAGNPQQVGKTPAAQGFDTITDPALLAQAQTNFQKLQAQRLRNATINQGLGGAGGLLATGTSGIAKQTLLGA